MSAVLSDAHDATALIARIAQFCRTHGLAESTFGRLAVNDGKFVGRLRDGGRVRGPTLARVDAFLASPPPSIEKPFVIGMSSNRSAMSHIAAPPAPNTPSPLTHAHVTLVTAEPPLAAPPTTPTSPTRSTSPQAAVHAAPHLPVATPPRAHSAKTTMTATVAPQAAGDVSGDSKTNFRFYDNRQKYLLFVNTCGEKQMIAQRIGLEVANIHPQPPAVRVFDAGVGDGTVLSRVMREMHRRYPTVPFYVVGKEISLEDVRLTLDKLADRFFEHPSSVVILTNLYYAEAPWLTPKSVTAASSMVWHDVSLTGSTAHEFEQQISALNPFLASHWTARASPTTGNPLYERPIVLVLYRDDYRFLLHDVIPKPGKVRADYDLVMASQPYRLRVNADFKAQKVLAPLARALGPGGRMIGIHSAGGDPGLDLIQRVWPGENPYTTDRHALLKALKAELGTAARNLNFNAYSDARSVFRYDMHTLPSEVGSSIGTSTLFAAWNAAVYVAQIEDQRLAETLTDGRYLQATRDVLQQHGGLWFNDESFVVSRTRD